MAQVSGIQSTSPFICRFYFLYFYLYFIPKNYPLRGWRYAPKPKFKYESTHYPHCTVCFSSICVMALYSFLKKVTLSPTHTCRHTYMRTIYTVYTRARSTGWSTLPSAACCPGSTPPASTHASIPACRVNAEQPATGRELGRPLRPR